MQCKKKKKFFFKAILLLLIDYILGMEAAVKETFSLFLCGDVMLARGIDMIQEHSCDPVLYEGMGHVVAYELHYLIISPDESRGYIGFRSVAPPPPPP